MGAYRLLVMSSRRRAGGSSAALLLPRAPDDPPAAVALGANQIQELDGHLLTRYALCNISQVILVYYKYAYIVSASQYAYE